MKPMRLLLVSTVLLLPLILLYACNGKAPDAPATSLPTGSALTPSAGQSATPETTGAVLLAVGDIGDCTSTADEAVAALAASLPGVIATLGDTVYEGGLAEEFARCFDPAWGTLKPRIRPAIGNHEYGSPQARDYFSYFGPAAGEPGAGYYSYDLGSWHAVVLNSNCLAFADGCGPASAQYRWLEADLAANPAACTVAYWHHPRFTSGFHGDERAMADLYALLYRAGTDVAITAHDHHYERFAPLNPDRQRDAERGIRQFIVGTGGGTLFPVAIVTGNSEVREVSTFGLLKLTLRDGAYEWSFEPVAGQAFRDAGSGKCHP